MNFKLELFESVKNKIYLIHILGIDIDSNKSTDAVQYFSVPETINVTEKYIESEVDLEYIKVNLQNFKNKDNVMKICKQLLKEAISEIYMLYIVCTSDEVDTKEDFDLLKESADEFMEQHVKYFSKVRTGEIWGDDDAENKIKCVKHNLLDAFSTLLKEYTEYKEVL